MKLNWRRRPTVNLDPIDHDFGPGLRRWGHNYSIITRRRDGKELSVCGWWEGIKKGDTIALENRDNDDGRSVYRVREIEYYRDPRDMWHATLVHDPRPRPRVTRSGDYV